MALFKPPQFSRYENNYFVITPLMFLLSIGFLAMYELGYSSNVFIICFYASLSAATVLIVPAAIQASDYIFEKKAIKQFSLKTLFPEFEIVEMLEEIHSMHSKVTIKVRVASLEKRLDCKVSI